MVFLHVQTYGYMLEFVWCHVDTWYHVVLVEVRFGHSCNGGFLTCFFTKFMVLITNPKSEFTLVASLVRYSRSKLPKGYGFCDFEWFLAFPCGLQCIKVVFLDAQSYGYMLEFV